MKMFGNPWGRNRRFSERYDLVWEGWRTSAWKGPRSDRPAKNNMAPSPLPIRDAAASRLDAMFFTVGSQAYFL